MSFKRDPSYTSVEVVNGTDEVGKVVTSCLQMTQNSLVVMIQILCSLSIKELGIIWRILRWPARELQSTLRRPLEIGFKAPVPIQAEVIIVAIC